MFKEYVARDISFNPVELTKEKFSSIIKAKSIIDAMYVDSTFKKVIGISNLIFPVPAVMQLLKDAEIARFILGLSSEKGSVLIELAAKPSLMRVFTCNSTLEETSLPEKILGKIFELTQNIDKWAGELDSEGDHVINLKTSSPGPHFYVNLLMGNRMGYGSALQTTPKSVVDRLGRGAFRSHADTQVLASRWDMRQEENGFPANRQFYLVENCEVIFYSADPNDANIESAVCVHSQNYSTISYKTKCGLEIDRIIFILPQQDGMPLATEVQQIIVKNTGTIDRKIKLVYTGMFGSGKPHSLFEDVLYGNIVMQSKTLMEDDGSVIAITPDYYPEPAKFDQRFHTMMLHQAGKVTFPKEFCTNYNEFVGNGTLEKPEGVYNLSNNHYRKGPGFFAVASEFVMAASETIIVDNFTGVVSDKTNPNFIVNETYKAEIANLVKKYQEEGVVAKVFEKNKEFFSQYRKFITLDSEDKQFNTYFNKNLPFQVLYQTFVSRSFCQTQKGYREIGFREIQDIFASMYYYVSMDMAEFVKQLLKEWCAKVFEFGYAYHNFYWEGKEAGVWSDDALWFVQALYRYIEISGDLDFLDEQVAVAGLESTTRPVYDTVKAIIRYSGQISVGKHGMPLLDRADWNDCLSVDTDFIDGITKEENYRKQLDEKGQEMGVPFESNYSESIMNAFLLKVAIDHMVILSSQKGDEVYSKQLSTMSQDLYERVQKHTWKEDFFARVLFNRYENNGFTYLGAKGDGLSADPEIDGSYWLNSFNWSILSSVATEEQISIMLDVLEKYMKTPYGIKLITPTDLERVAKGTATGHYFLGDRENGGVFKHATMMATSAMFKAAKEVGNKALAERLSTMAYWMIDLVLPYKTMENPFNLCGNPRFCTQYNNSDTGENIGPMLSGTSTWLILTLLSAFGVEYTRDGIVLNPIMRIEQTIFKFSLNTGKTTYNIVMNKIQGFHRILDDKCTITLDGKILENNILPIFKDHKEHDVSVVLS